QIRAHQPFDKLIRRNADPILLFLFDSQGAKCRLNSRTPLGCCTRLHVQRRGDAGSSRLVGLTVADLILPYSMQGQRGAVQSFAAGKTVAGVPRGRLASCAMDEQPVGAMPWRQ
ncbi:MAG: hypothetical protein ACOYL7_09005, partial [Caldilinea sp.]